MDAVAQHLELSRAHSAPNYAPLPVVLADGEGAWVRDVDGREYLDFLACYSALNLGHRHPALLAAASAQLERLTLTGRAFHHDQLAPFCAELAAFCGLDLVLPMNTGAEAVETAVKAARKWGYEVKGVPAEEAVIVACEGNFHGRTTTAVSFSTTASARAGFGPFTPGFRLVPFGDAEALAAALDERVVAFLVEPVQGERGVVVPPEGYLARARWLCDEAGVLLIADEVQSAFGRTGARFACDHDGVRPDAYLLGKALGGGIVPVSAMVARREVLEVLGPGTHGSTFGGNPLACAVAREVLRQFTDGPWVERACKLGAYLHAELARADLGRVSAIRGRGPWIGLDVAPAAGGAAEACHRLAERGLLCKETHEATLRLSPPLVVSEAEVDWALEQLAAVLG